MCICAVPLGMAHFLCLFCKLNQQASYFSPLKTLHPRPGFRGSARLFAPLRRCFPVKEVRGLLLRQEGVPEEV